MNIKKVIIYADGAARGNPGPAAIGVTIKDEEGRLITSISRRLGTTTNNQAEYQAVIAALETAVSLGASHVDLNVDSELVERQINGKYRVKNAGLISLYQEVLQLRSRLQGFSITHVRREQNTEADKLANKALDAIR
ncbi:ribonuclease HI family protein [Chloroflexota bacterium]